MYEIVRVGKCKLIRARDFVLVQPAEWKLQAM